MSSKRSRSEGKDSLIKYYSKDNNKELVLDFSKIQNTAFDSLLSDLVKAAKDQIESLVFSLDLYHDVHPEEFLANEGHLAFPEESPKAKKSQNEPVMLKNSAFISNSKAMRSILIALKSCLKKTETINSIRFRSMLFKKQDFNTITDLLRECPTLTSIAFENMPLYDEGFSFVAKCAKKEGLKRFECINCGISDDSVVKIKEILSFHLFANLNLERETSEFQQNCLQELILRGNFLSEEALIEISEEIGSLPMVLLDLSHNKMIDEKVAMRAMKTIPHCNILVNEGNKKKKAKKTSRAASIASQSEEKFYEEPEIIEEPESRPTYYQMNDNIRIPILNLDNIRYGRDENEIILTDGIKIVGPNAQKFAGYFKELQDSLIKKQQKNEKEQEEKMYFMEHSKLRSTKPKKRSASATRKSRK